MMLDVLSAKRKLRGMKNKHDRNRINGVSFSLFFIGLAALFGGVVAAGCSDDDSATPKTCGPNTCNETNGGGVCDDSTGEAVCTCNEGYTGSGCNRCASGYNEEEGACLPELCGANTCNEANGGGSCDDSSGTAVCTCNEGYLGPT